MKNINKSKSKRPERNIGSTDRQREIELEHSLKKMKQIINVLSVVILICIVWIAYLIMTSKQSSPSQIKVVSNDPTVENSSGTNTSQSQPAIPYDMPAGSQQNNTPPNITSNTNNSTLPPAQNTAPGLNPPHGQPGHRCDISVGSPLNSPPAKNNTNPATTPPTNNNSMSITPVNNNTNPMIDIQALPDTSTKK